MHDPDPVTDTVKAINYFLQLKFLENGKKKSKFEIIMFIFNLGLTKHFLILSL